MIAINKYSSYVQSIDHLKRSIHVWGDYPSAQTIQSLIGSLENLLNCAEFLNRHDWPEDFFSRNGHVVSNVCENGRLDKIPGFSCPFPSTYQLGPLALADLNVFQYFLKLSFIYLRALRGGLQKGISNDYFFCGFDWPFHKLVINLLLH